MKYVRCLIDFVVALMLVALIMCCALSLGAALVDVARSVQQGDLYWAAGSVSLATISTLVGVVASAVLAWVTEHPSEGWGS